MPLWLRRYDAWRGSARGCANDNVPFTLRAEPVDNVGARARRRDTCAVTNIAPERIEAPGPVPTRPRSRALAIGALVAAVISAALCWMPVVGVAVAFAGVVLGIIACLLGRPKWVAIVAVVVSAVAALVGAIVVSLATAPIVAGAWQDFTNDVDAQVAEFEETGGPSDAVAPLIDPSEFSRLDQQGFDAIMAAATEHHGEKIVLFGEVQEISEDGCALSIFVDDSPQNTWEGYEVFALAYSASSETGAAPCPELERATELSHVKLFVSVFGSTTVDFDDGSVEEAIQIDVHRMDYLPRLP